MGNSLFARKRMLRLCSAGGGRNRAVVRLAQTQSEAMPPTLLDGAAPSDVDFAPAPPPNPPALTAPQPIAPRLTPTLEMTENRGPGNYCRTDYSTRLIWRAIANHGLVPNSSMIRASARFGTSRWGGMWA